MQERITHWPTTIPGLGILVFLGVVVWKRPDMVDKPEALLLLAGGLLGLLLKGRNNGQ